VSSVILIITQILRSSLLILRLDMLFFFAILFATYYEMYIILILLYLL